MPLIFIHLSTPAPTSFRAAQIAGLFDVPLDERLSHTLSAEVPGLDEDWQIGAIVGPSGSGKSTLAQAAFGEIYQPPSWPEREAIIDVLSAASLRQEMSSTGSGIKEILRVLTAVGLSSPPAWLKPYRVLSTGERFRADMARAILEAGDGRLEADATNVAGSPSGLEPPAPRLNSHASLQSPAFRPLLVIDEFTGALDRTIACTASAALAKFLRGAGSSRFGVRLVAVTCHADILPWLAPNWVLDLAGDSETGRPKLVRGRLRRGEVRLAVRRVPQSLWPRFARHHYLSGGLSTAATCYAAFAEAGGWGLEAGAANDPSLPTSFQPPVPSLAAGPVAFCAVVATLGWKGRKRITRLVVSPEWQGLGIGPQLAERVAACEHAKGFAVSITASHPAIVGHMSRSPRWRYTGLKKTGSTRQRLADRAIRCSTGRAVASFEWVGE